MSAQTWITIITAIISTGTAIFLAIITWRYVRLTNEILKATNTPKVILFLDYDGKYFILCVQNIGMGYASNIEFTGDLSFKPPHRDGATLGELEPYKSGIKYLGPGHKIKTYLYSPRDTFDEDLQVSLKNTYEIVVTYKDSANTSYKESPVSFEFGDWISGGYSISQQNDDLETTLDKIARALDDMAENTNDIQNNRANALNRIADALEKKSSDE